MKDELENVLSDDEWTRIHEILGCMGYHPYPVPDPPKLLWSKHTATMNCPADDGFERLLHEAKLRAVLMMLDESQKWIILFFSYFFSVFTIFFITFFWTLFIWFLWKHSICF